RGDPRAHPRRSVVVLERTADVATESGAIRRAEGRRIFGGRPVALRPGDNLLTGTSLTRYSKSSNTRAPDTRRSDGRVAPDRERRRGPPSDGGRAGRGRARPPRAGPRRSNQPPAAASRYARDHGQRHACGLAGEGVCGIQVLHDISRRNSILAPPL